jgi:hypothetical protein
VTDRERIALFLDRLCNREEFRNPPGGLLARCPIQACTNLIIPETGPCTGCRGAFGAMLRRLNSQENSVDGTHPTGWASSRHSLERTQQGAGGTGVVDANNVTRTDVRSPRVMSDAALQMVPPAGALQLPPVTGALPAPAS